MNVLISKIKNGDKKAVLEFYKSFSPQIQNYFSSQLQNKRDARELLKDVFLDAIDNLSFFKEKNDIQTWLHKIAQNKLTNYYRKNKIKSILLSQIPFLQIVEHEVHQPKFQLEKNKIRDRVEATLRSLPNRYRIILELRYGEQIPVKQIALILKLSFKAAESLLFRARQSFKLAYERTTIS